MTPRKGVAAVLQIRRAGARENKLALTAGAECEKTINFNALKASERGQSLVRINVGYRVINRQTTQTWRQFIPSLGLSL